MNTILRLLRFIEDFFVLPISSDVYSDEEDQKQYLIENPPVANKEVRIAFRRMLVVWVCSIAVPVFLQWWLAALLTSSGAILHFSYFKEAQKISGQGELNIRGDPHMRPVYVPPVVLAIYLLAVFMVWALIVHLIETMFWIGGIGLAALVIAVYFWVFSKVKTTKYWGKFNLASEYNPKLTFLKNIIRLICFFPIVYSVFGVLFLALNIYENL